MGDLVACQWCGLSLSEHADTRPTGVPIPKVPCLGLKSGYLARLKEKPVDLSKWARPPIFTCEGCRTESRGCIDVNGLWVGQCPQGWWLKTIGMKTVYACSEDCAKRVEAGDG